MNIILLAPKIQDGTSFYRAAGPLNLMQKTDQSIQVRLAKEIDWSSITWADVVLAQRPFKADHLEFIQCAKQCGVKVWVDMDDDLFNLGTHNLAYDIYNSPGTPEIISQCVSLADVLSVSTEHLATRYQHPNRWVIPNAYPDYLSKYLSTSAPQKHSILWRGSKTHNKDLIEVKDDVLAFMKENPTIRWHFLGYNPWFITQEAPKDVCKYHPPVACVSMFDLIHELNASIAVVPLEVDTFNQSKSNIAWMEYSAGGSLVVAPALQEWVRPGVLTYGKGSFKKALDKAVSMSYNRRAKAVSTSQDFIKHELMLSTMNTVRQLLLESIT